MSDDDDDNFSAFSQHYYPVLGVLASPGLTAYGRQVGRSIVRYFRGTGPEPCSWDSGGAGRVPRWQTGSFERVDDIPRRKMKADEGLSPRRGNTSVLAPQWIAKQQRRPAAVVSLHSVGGEKDDGADIARNRVCLASYGVPYFAMVIVSRADNEPAGRVAGLQQRSGLDAAQFLVCGPGGSGDAFQAFLGDVERRVYARACAFYAAAFVRTQTKLMSLPQLPFAREAGGKTPLALASDQATDDTVTTRFARFMPVRAWLARYHFKLAVLAECAGDRDTAQRCAWLAYAHLLTLVGESGLERGAGVMIEALNVRVARGWLYQAQDATALRAAQTRAPPIVPVSRSGVASEYSSGGSLDALVFSVHAGECSAATEQLMATERMRRKKPGVEAALFVALGSETLDADLLQPIGKSCGWWPLGGHYAVVDFPGTRAGLVVNSSLDVAATSSLLPESCAYDKHLALAARQCVEHVMALERVIGRGDLVARQHRRHADLYEAAVVRGGVDFAAALEAPSACPLWTWPASAAPLLRAAALARLHKDGPTAPSKNTRGDALADAVRLLTAAIAGPADAESLARSIGDPKTGRQLLGLASDLAECHAGTGNFADALTIFHSLVQRLRAEQWTPLALHALRWVVRCAAAVNDTQAEMAAAVELLSAPGAQPLSPGSLGVATEIDMTCIYSPITCHAHWRHWRLLAGERTMRYQVTIDCCALGQPLTLESLDIEISDPGYSLQITHDDDDSASKVEEGLRFCDVAGSGSVPSKCSLALEPGLTLVIEGEAEIGKANAGSGLVLVGVSAVVSGSSGNLRLVWPTCAQAPSAPEGSAAEENDQGFSHMEALLAASNAATSPIRQWSKARPHVAAASYADHALVSRAAAVAGPATAVPQNRRWLGTAGQWERLALPPLQLAEEDCEPGFSAYSRCRVFRQPAADGKPPGLVVSMPSVADRVPAYRGEAFAVEIMVHNTHPHHVALDIIVDVLIVKAGSAALEDTAELGSGNGADQAWLGLEPGSQQGGSSLRGLRPGADAVQPGESRTLTVYLHFPDTRLASARRQSSAAAAAAAANQVAVQSSVRYSADGVSHVTTHQESIPVVRPLCASAEVLPARVAAPELPLPPCGFESLREHCFRRPVLVALRNSGPWDIVVDAVSMHPPADVLCCHSRVAVAGSTVAGPMALRAGCTLNHVFWVDVLASDAVRMPSDMSLGVLRVTWSRGQCSSTARLWLAPVQLVRRGVVVESHVSMARVGAPLALAYRVTNTTRTTRALDVSMHAADGFVFGGPRRATVTVLPADSSVLRFCLVPLAALGSAQPPLFSALSAKDPNVGPQGWMALPRLEVKPAASAAAEESSPSLASSVIGAPPPTRATTSAVNLQSDVLAHAQQTIVALAGDDAQCLLTPGLAAQCVDMLPPHLLLGADMRHRNGAESDFEDGDDDDDDKDDDEPGLPDSDEIVRYDQTVVYCLPSSSVGARE